VPPHAPN